LGFERENFLQKMGTLELLTERVFMDVFLNVNHLTAKTIEKAENLIKGMNCKLRI
jgi:hypothetical protein